MRVLRPCGGILKASSRLGGLSLVLAVKSTGTRLEQSKCERNVDEVWLFDYYLSTSCCSHILHNRNYNVRLNREAMLKTQPDLQRDPRQSNSVVSLINA